MIPALVALHARRVAGPPAVVVVLGVASLAALGAPVDPTFDPAPELDAEGAAVVRASAAWIAGLVAIVALTLVPAARIPEVWFRREGAWLGPSGASRARIVMSAGAGVTAGCVVLAAMTAATAAAFARGDRARPLYELGVTAGPTRSVVLAPGETFEQSLEGTALTPESLVRVRVMPTYGGRAPATRAVLGSADGAPSVSVARRTWLESPADPAHPTVSVANVGEGALAVLGPRAVEVWRPSEALFGGTARLAFHVALFAATLAALAFALGAWMSPGVAALLAFAVWLGARMALEA
ncbi:MAG: hypothetical protein AAGB93_25780, partial [Planctomycetota bacterium]